MYTYLEIVAYSREQHGALSGQCELRLHLISAVVWAKAVEAVAKAENIIDDRTIMKVVLIRAANQVLKSRKTQLERTASKRDAQMLDETKIECRGPVC